MSEAYVSELEAIIDLFIGEPAVRSAVPDLVKRAVTALASEPERRRQVFTFQGGGGSGFDVGRFR